MRSFLDITALLYLLGMMIVLTFIASYGLLLLTYAVHRRRHIDPPAVRSADLPTVTIQLPVYNEAHVIGRLIDACARMDYPPDRFDIHILDDSTDDTAHIIAAHVRRLHASGMTNIAHIRRSDRAGFKAGALADGLHRTTSDCIAIFDADFVPPADFLRRTCPHFSADPRLALVQTRWSHLNHDTNPLTRAQAMNIDVHFAVEQVARNRGGFPMSMNGTGAVWRASAIHDAGGWSSATLTEDLDLSYRAQLRGWRFRYLPDVAVPGELPPLVQAYKTQQARWAIGSTQCLLRHGWAVLTTPRYTPLQKLMGLLHLAQYLIQPVLLILFLLTPPLLFDGFFGRLPNVGLLSSAGLIPPLMIAISQYALYPDWPRRLSFFPAQFMIGAAMVLNNSVAIWLALTRRDPEFKRTPKFRLTRDGGTWSHSAYRPAADYGTLAEFALSLYALIGAVAAARMLPALVPYMLIYALSFGALAAWNVRQSGLKATG